MTYRDESLERRAQRWARLDTALDEAEREAIEAEIARADQSRREDARVHLPLVARARVASPCAERWDAMLGDGAVRSCARCDSEVFDLGLMTLAAAERFVRSRIGAQSCVRLHRRADGTMLFADCEVGARGVRRRTQGLAVAAVAIGAASAAVMAAPPPRAPLVLPASPQQPITAPSAMFALPEEPPVWDDDGVFYAMGLIVAEPVELEGSLQDVLRAGAAADDAEAPLTITHVEQSIDPAPPSTRNRAD